jgi:hypothetical protein
MYLCSTQTPAAETGHASWQTGQKSYPPLLVIAEWQCKCGKMMDIVWILDNLWHAIASSFVYNDRLFQILCRFLIK